MLTLEQIKEKKVSGDLVAVGKILSLSPDIVGASLKRANSKHHRAVVAAFTKVINDREILISSLQ